MSPASQGEVPTEVERPSAPRVRRPCLHVFGACAAGIVLWRLAPLGEAAGAGGLIAAVGAAGVLCAVFWRRRAATAASVVVLVAAGYVWAFHRCTPAGDDICRFLPAAPTPLEVEGRVVSADLPPSEAAARDAESRWRFVLAVAVARGDGPSREVSGRVRVTVRGASVPGLVPGQRIRLLATLSRPRAPSVPGAFDYSAYLARQGIFSTAVTTAGSGVEVLDAAPWYSMRATVYRTRCAILGVLRRTLEPDKAALMAALLIGQREELPRSELERYYQSGVGHIFAVSGLHVALVAGAMWLILTHAGVRRKHAGVAVAAAVVFYAALAGCRTPAVRAATMTVAFVGAVLTDREGDPVNVLSLAAVVILAWRPGELFGAGFALSFTAVLFITLLYGRLEGWWQRSFGLPPELMRAAGTGPAELVLRWLRRSVWVSLSAYLGLWPLVLYHFGYIVLWSVPVNAFVVPWLWLVLLVGVVLVGAGAVGGVIAAPVVWLAEAALAALSAMVGVAGALPWSPVYLPPPHPGWLGLYYALWALTLTRAEWRPRPKAVLAAWIVAANLFLAVNLFGAGRGASRVDFIDVGRGDSTLVRLPGGGSEGGRAGGTILVDAGCGWESSPVPDFLAAEGVSSIDVLVLTRDDEDSLSGVMEILERFAVGKVLLPTSAAPTPELRAVESACRRLGMRCERPHVGDRLTFGGAIIEILGPARPASVTAAAQSSRPPTTWRLTLPEGLRILFTGPSRTMDLRPVTRLEPEKLRAEVLRLSCGYARPSSEGEADVMRDLSGRSGARIAVLGLADYERTNPGPARLLEILLERRLKLLATDEHGTVRLEMVPAGWATLRGHSGGEWRRLDAIALPGG